MAPGSLSCGLLSTFYSLAVAVGCRAKGVAMAFAFEKLLVYQKAVAFADAVCSLTRGFPRGCFFLADQLRQTLKRLPGCCPA